MSENKHTQEPLTYMELPTADGEFMVLGGVGQEYGLVASCVKLEDARRIVACVNACAGMSISDVKLWAESGGFSRLNWIVASTNQAARLVHAETQRDGLLAALEKYVTVMSRCGGGDKQLFMAAIREADNEARAAIASVKGGAQAETAKNEGSAA